ncbi:MAG TPA: hypothetical protein VFF74_07055 [Methylophilaceae bacterium]|nr:hypothetical protein [Methylophilaceae bacterium]
MNSLRVLIMTGLFTGLTGCATTTPAERSAQMQRQAEEMVQIYGPACDKLGYVKDSNPWRDCVLNLATQENMKLYNRMYNYPVGGPYFGYRRFYHYPW